MIPIVLVALVLEFVAATAGIAAVAIRRKRLADVAIYGVLAAIVIGVTGFAGEFAWKADPSKSWEASDPRLWLWGLAVAPLPLAVALLISAARVPETFKTQKPIILAGALLAAPLGIPVAQYMPLTGGIASFAQPWSEARLDAVPVHVLILAVIGGAIGAFAIWRTGDRSSSPGKPGASP